jgi:hypothetical protein
MYVIRIIDTDYFVKLSGWKWKKDKQSLDIVDLDNSNWLNCRILFLLELI